MKPVINPVLQAKFLQHLNNKKKGNEGFTLIELLVVVIIIGVLAAIALPSLLGQVNKGKQAEAKQNIGAMNRAQQAFFLEGQVFASSVSSLGIGIKTVTDNYSYSINSLATGNVYGQQNASSLKATLKSYYGSVNTQIGDTTTSEALTVAISCESTLPGITIVANQSGAASCVSNYGPLSK